MKILITGVSGFIGGNLYNFLNINHNYEMYGLDKEITSEDLNLTKIDIRDPNELIEYFKNLRPDVVIHCAARTDLGGSSLSDYDSNTVGCYNIVNACEINKEKKPILLSFSSMLVCGRGHIPLNENDYSASTFYGASKVISELYTRRYSGDYVLLRPTSIWGPGFKSPYRNFFETVIAKKFIAPNHNKLATKSYGYIENVQFQIEYIFNNIEIFNKNKIIYLLDNNEYNIGDWADEISLLLGYKKYLKTPLFFFKYASYLGDLLSIIKINFPLTTFRYKNMTINYKLPHDNRFDCLTQKYIPRKIGVKRTLEWLAK